jgi:alginate biosynthesis protein Alg44
MEKEIKPKTAEKVDKSDQIVHEAEITRQHARYKIPAKIEIEGRLYKVEDWSVSGCAIKNLPDEIYRKEFAIGKMIFKFDDFETVVDNLKLEFLDKRPNGVVGCRFTELTPQQLAILNQIIASYLAGDIVTEDDIIHAVTRSITYEKKEKPEVDKKKASLILILIYIVVVILLLFLFYVAYKRVYVVQTDNAYVDANITTIRAPAPTYVYYPKKLYEGEKVKTGDVLLTAYLVAGGIQKIASPINAEILKISALNGDFRNVAEPILYLLPKRKNSIYITAHVAHESLIKLKIGDIATVRTPDGRKFYAKLVKIIPANTVYQKKAKFLLENVYNKPRNYDTLLFYTNYPLNEKMINESLFLTIDTFLNRIGFLSLNDNDVKEKYYEDNEEIKQKNNNQEEVSEESEKKALTPDKQEVNYSNYGKVKGNDDIVKNQDESQEKSNIKNDYSDNFENIYNKDESNDNSNNAAEKNNYCIIVASTKNLHKDFLNKFYSLFPNGKIEKYKNLYEFKIVGFKDYESAREYIQDKVSKYYKRPFIIKCRTNK